MKALGEIHPQNQIQKTMSLNPLHKKPSPILILTLLAMQLYIITPYQPPSTCSNISTKYYNILTLTCTDCPANTQKAADGTYCNCTNTHYPNWSVIGFNHPDSCKPLLPVGTSYNKSNQVLSLFDQKGTFSPAVVTCAANAYPVFAENRCVPCGYDSGMTYDATLKACRCPTGYGRVGEVCYAAPANWSRTYPITDVFNYLAQEYVKIGCQLQNLPQPCNMLINLCVKFQYSSSNYFCQLLSNLSTQSKSSLPTYKFTTRLTDSIGVYASSKIGINTTTVKNQLNIIKVQYDIYGAIKDISAIGKELFECDVTDEDVVRFASFGLNLDKKCASKRQFKNERYYDFFVETSDGKLAQIPVYYQGAYYKRISPSTATGSHSFQLQFISVPPMLVPILTFSSSSTPSITTISNASQVSLNWIVPFVIFNIALFVVFILVMYRQITYNPSDDPNDQYFLCKGFITILIKLFYTWSYGLWIWMFGFSLYIFAFYKFQQTIYLIVPDQKTQWKLYYQFFMIIFYSMLVITAISLWIVIYNLGEVDYFLIDWEKQKDSGKFDVNKKKKEVSVWRRVFLANELYKIAISKRINLRFVTLFALLFLAGLQWINLSYSLPFTSPLTPLSATTKTSNVVLSYFIITFVVFIIAVVKLVIRHLIKIWVALPSQNFVDLCSMTNFSILMFHEYLHGYYIHGMHPSGQAQGSLQYIEDTLEKQGKAFGKNRGFKNDDPESCQTFQVVYPLAIRRNFLMKYKAPLLQKMVPKNYQSQSVFSNPLPDDWDESDYDQVEKLSLSMVDNFKMYLQCVKASTRHVLDRSWWTKFISCPITQQQVGIIFSHNFIGSIPVFMKDKWQDFTNVFVSGHEFLFLFNFINWVNVWFIATGNVYFALILAVIVNELLFEKPAQFLVKRNISKNTFIEEKFFNW